MSSDFSHKFFTSTITAWEGMYQAILGAQKSVYWEIYTFIDDKSGQMFTDLLCQKSAQGIDVKLILDAVGSYSLSQESIKKLRASGIAVIIFHPLSLNLTVKDWWRRMWQRTHCKLLLIDEEIAFVGGVNISHQMMDWDDLHLRLTGQVIRPLLRYFGKKYIRLGGSDKEVKHLLYSTTSDWFENVKPKIKYILHTPKYARPGSPFRGFYRRSLRQAKNSFNLLTPYYAPDPMFLELVYRAVKRGVKVNIILPFQTDIRLMAYMAKAFYGISKKAGASFYFLKKMNHGKAVSVDNQMGLVGSANLTPRGLFLNHEAGVVFTEERMVRELNSILENWKQQADPLLELDFKRQGWFRRFKDWWVRRVRDYV